MMPNSANVGKAQERAIVKHAKANGFPGADRIIPTGAGKDYAVRADQGDVWLCPGVIVQSKRLEPIRKAELAVPKWLAETEAQRVAAGADWALLIVYRYMHADVGEWWAFFWFSDLIRLHSGPASALWNSDRTDRMPVRLTVADAYTLLRAAGYGTAIEEGA